VLHTGLVPKEPEMLQLANGDLVEANPPIWGIDIKVINSILYSVECKNWTYQLDFVFTVWERD